MTPEVVPVPQNIIDLDAAVPELLHVKCGGVIYDLPGDISIPDFLEIERLVKRLDGSTGEADEESTGSDTLQALYDKVLALFQIEQPELEELPMGPRRLGALIPQLYTAAADGDGGEQKRPTKGGTRSTKRSSKRSASSRS
jgi:hypothetical protein